MYRIILIPFAFLLASLSLTSCEKLDLPPGVASCIEDKIREIKQQDVRNPPAAVWQYQYNGKTVYYIPSYCCDMYSELYDADCNLICHPDGGITGSGDGKCTDFFEKRTNEKLIWKDNR
ncbi:DUF6970 domain-containing protein [Pontibacter ruber]|uniref:DUF6970 domain-containing protein n=1 Tax=Pontibacter ruber TaxID=1343895 RepID=A0ABW5CUN8_9BACT|nr:hypothetical protein [Pontibacter ruber]